MSLLPDRRLEAVAQNLAKMMSPEEASAAAGYDAKKTSFASNARKRACRKDVKARVADLLEASIPDVIEQASDFIKRRCIELAAPDLGRKKLKPSDQIAALTLYAKVTGALAPEKHDHSFSGHGDKLDAALKRLAGG
jgi:hypothetical protein